MLNRQALENGQVEPAGEQSLPGGLMVDGRRLRSFAFRTINGEVEMHLAESMERSRNRPETVTTALAGALGHIGGLEPTPDRIRSLAVGDRQFLMRRLAILLGLDAVWITAECGNCDSAFDAEVIQSEMPVKEAPDPYPFASVVIRRRRWKFRVPAGIDQESVAGPRGDHSSDARKLLESCLVGPLDADFEMLSARDMARVESALEDASPEVGNVILSDCPSCEAPNEIFLDPYAGIEPNVDELLSDVHVIAATYQWPQAEILGMGRNRRRRYVGLIERMQGALA